jgi:hypothetical protein
MLTVKISEEDILSLCGAIAVAGHMLTPRSHRTSASVIQAYNGSFFLCRRLYGELSEASRQRNPEIGAFYERLHIF